MGRSFRAEIGGTLIARVIEVARLSEARKWASEFTPAADWCNVYRGERLVAQYRRAESGKWYKVDHVKDKN